jgi:hypothetical protein
MLTTAFLCGAASTMLVMSPTRPATANSAYGRVDATGRRAVRQLLDAASRPPPQPRAGSIRPSHSAAGWVPSRALTRCMARLPAAMPATAMAMTSQTGAPRSMAVMITNPSNNAISVKPMSSR